MASTILNMIVGESAPSDQQQASRRETSPSISVATQPSPQVSRLRVMMPHTPTPSAVDPPSLALTPGGETAQQQQQAHVRYAPEISSTSGYPGACGMGCAPFGLAGSASYSAHAPGAGGSGSITVGDRALLVPPLFCSNVIQVFLLAMKIGGVCAPLLLLRVLCRMQR